MRQPNISSSGVFIFLTLSAAMLTGIIGTDFTDYALGQRASGPGGIDTSQPASTSGPGGIDISQPNATRGPLPIVTEEPDDTTETTLATTTTATSTYSSTKGGLHISTTITNTTTVIPVQP
jgi:hypothetical protein